jgi:hypothetical protein
MKKITLFLSILLAGIFVAAQTVPLQVIFKFKNIVEGYDHNCKAEVFIDGESVGVSAEVKESKGTVFTVDVPAGTHAIKVVNYAEYEGNWEEHSIENNYSIDCTYEEQSHRFKKKNKLYMVYDIDTQAYVNWGKAPKIKKPKKNKNEAAG